MHLLQEEPHLCCVAVGWFWNILRNNMKCVLCAGRNMGGLRVARVVVLCVLCVLWGAFDTANAEIGLASQGTKIFAAFGKKNLLI